MANFRNGQWVSTATKIEGCHCTPDGRCVGIYRYASCDSYGNTVPEHVSFQRPEPAMLPHPVTGEDVPHHDLGVYLPPDQCADLQPLADKKHIPAGRAPYTDAVPEMRGVAK